jgi:hypothetical protein
MIEVRERRAAQRAPLGAKVSWQVMGRTEWHEDTSRDLSSSGMMLRTQVAVKPGATLKLKFNLPNLKFQDPIVADAEVMRVVERRGRQTGLGLRFLTLKSRNYQVVHDFVCRILGLPLDDTMEGLAGARDGDDYTFSMEQLTREVEARKAARLEEKLAGAEALRRKGARRVLTWRAIKTVLWSLGLFVVFKILAYFWELVNRIGSPH